LAAPLLDTAGISTEVCGAISTQFCCAGLWGLHLSSLDALGKYFFAHDKQKYARLVLLYLAKMTALQTTDPDIHEEFMDGNSVVNKNKIPFCAIGVDHAVEHISRITKVTG